MVLHDQWAEDLLRRLHTVEPVAGPRASGVRRGGRSRVLVVAVATIFLFCAGVAYAVSE
jgi:hypothetical protein